MATFTGPLVCVLVMLALAANSYHAHRGTIPVPTQLMTVHRFNTNSRTQLKSVYTWINNSSLVDPLKWDILGLNQINVINCTSLSVSQKRTRVYRQLKLFVSPFYLAYSWEKKLGGSHASAANELRKTRTQLALTCALLKAKITGQVPAVQPLTEELLNNATREFLTEQNVSGGPISDNAVKGYRNYLITTMLQRLTGYLLWCLPFRGQ